MILDSNAKPSDFVAMHAKRHCFLAFDDVEDATEGRLVTAEQIETGLEFAKKSSQLLVFCRAGQSRSAAMALLIACQNLGLDAARNVLNPRRHIPNRHVVRLGAERLEMPEVEAAFLEWRNEHGSIVLSDYYDEIEREIDQLEESGVVNKIVVE